MGKKTVAWKKGGGSKKRREAGDKPPKKQKTKRGNGGKGKRKTLTCREVWMSTHIKMSGQAERRRKTTSLKSPSKSRVAREEQGRRKGGAMGGGV